MKRKNLLLVFSIIGLVLIADQSLKIYIKTHFILGQSIPVFANWFYLLFVENEGMAYGIKLGGNYGKLMLSIFRLLAMGFILYYILRLSKLKTHKGILTGWALIFAGAAGNMIDSAFYGLLFSESYVEPAQFLSAKGGYAGFLYGHVVDMFYFPIIQSHFPEWFPIWGGQEFVFFSPVFNIADASITCGVGVLFVFQKHLFKESWNIEDKNTKSPQETA